MARFGSTRKKPDPEIPVVAMADIAFLLIIFFLVTTQMEKLKTQELKVPDTRESEDKEMKVKNLQINLKGALAIIGEKQFKLPDQLPVMQAYVASTVRTKTRTEDKVVILQSDINVKWELWVNVVEAIKAAGGIPAIQTEEVVYQKR